MVLRTCNRCSVNRMSDMKKREKAAVESVRDVDLRPNFFPDSSFTSRSIQRSRRILERPKSSRKSFVKERRILLFSRDGFAQAVSTATTEEGSPQFVAIVCNDKSQKMDYSCNLSDFPFFFLRADDERKS